VSFFTSSGTGYSMADGKEFFAIGNSVGEIHYVEINGSSFNKGVGFQMTDESPITAISGDQKS
jgi:uncharacterized protein YxjI